MRGVTRAMRFRLSSRGRDEDGSIIVLWAVALTAIMGLVAMSIDLGNIGQTKQHTQNAADAAALAGVVDLAGSGGEIAAVSDAETYLLDNYSLRSPDWNSCGALPSGVTTYPGADCFGFFTTGGSPSPNAMAVQMPPQSVSATFGKADGFNGAVVTSTAYASVQSAQSSFIIPFAYQAGGGGGLQCLKTGSGNSTCDNTFTTGPGQFGTFDSPRYVIFPGSDSSSGNNPVTQTDVVLGLDHQLVPYTAPPEICDAEKTPPNCPLYNTTPPYRANYVAPSTGQASSDLNGLFEPVTSPDGSCTFAPRLDHPEGFVATASCSADLGVESGSPPVTPLTVPELDTSWSNYPLNGQSVSAFLNTNGQAFASSCTLPANASTTPIDAKDQSGSYVWTSYDNCLSGLLSSYTPASGPIFSSSIVNSPRFGVVPLVSSANGSGAEAIQGFDDVYLDVMFGKNKTVDAVLAWIFPPKAVEPTSTVGQGLGGYYGGAYVTNLCAYGTNC